MFILKRITLIIRYAECPNFDVANSIKPALTSREITLMVSVLEVEVKLNLPICAYSAFRRIMRLMPVFR